MILDEVKKVFSSVLKVFDSMGAAILAGGRASRLGNLAKGNLVVREDQKTIIEHALDILKTVGLSHRVIVAKEQTAYERYGCPIVLDRRSESASLVGVESALHHFQSKKNIKAVLVVPCDLPFLTATVILRLIECFEETSDTSIVFAKDSRNKNHYLCAVIRIDCLASVSGALDQKAFAIHALWDTLRAKAVRCKDRRAFVNINAPADWRCINGKNGSHGTITTEGINEISI